ncbi:MAG: hypothetical protein BWY89_00450 [Bacteroidetes bacterium ADurb.BinA012]|nr:MAG: hypothetical protein BWY89_00450 [Bacteroidetes bacterium ADurb.BinA012]
MNRAGHIIFTQCKIINPEQIAPGNPFGIKTMLSRQENNFKINNKETDKETLFDQKGFSLDKKNPFFD